MLRLATALLVVLLAAACGADEAAAPQRRWIALVPAADSGEFWDAVRAGADRAARELGVDLLWRAPPRADAREVQGRLVDDFVTRRVAALVVAPLDERALIGPLVDAAASGIPVVLLERAIAWDGAACVVASDPRRAGALAAERLGTRLGGRGAVVVLRPTESSPLAREREAGFVEALHERFPTIELRDAPATSDGIFAPDAATAAAALETLHRERGATAVRLVACGTSGPLVAALAAGRVDALVVDDPAGLGEQGLRAAAAALEGRPPQPRIDAGSLLATPENLREPAIAAALAATSGA